MNCKISREKLSPWESSNPKLIRRTVSVFLMFQGIHVILKKFLPMILGIRAGNGFRTALNSIS